MECPSIETILGGLSMASTSSQKETQDNQIRSAYCCPTMFIIVGVIFFYSWETSHTKNVMMCVVSVVWRPKGKNVLNSTFYLDIPHQLKPFSIAVYERQKEVITCL